MARKTISLDEEAYERLKAHKREDESFSDAVKRLTSGRSWKEVAGFLSEEEAEELEQIVESSRSRTRHEQPDDDFQRDG